MAQAKYRYPKMSRSTSYEKEVERRLDLMRLAGAELTLKVYTSRPPARYADRFDIDGEFLRNTDTVFVVILSGKRLVNATLVTKETWHNTVKVSDRDGTDDMLGFVDDFLSPLENYIDSRK